MYPNSGVLWGAGLMRAALAASEVHLFKDGSGVVLEAGLTLATIAAAECDFTGYVPVSITAFNPPLLMPVGGAGTDSGLAQFLIATPFTVPNTVGGGWLETSAGVLVCAWSYDPVRSLIGAGDGITVDLIPIFG